MLELARFSAGRETKALYHAPGARSIQASAPTPPGSPSGATVNSSLAVLPASAAPVALAAAHRAKSSAKVFEHHIVTEQVNLVHHTQKVRVTTYGFPINVVDGTLAVFGSIAPTEVVSNGNLAVTGEQLQGLLGVDLVPVGVAYDPSLIGDHHPCAIDTALQTSNSVTCQAQAPAGEYSLYPYNELGCPFETHAVVTVN